MRQFNENLLSSDAIFGGGVERGKVMAFVLGKFRAKRGMKRGSGGFRGWGFDVLYGLIVKHSAYPVYFSWLLYADYAFYLLLNWTFKMALY